MAVNIKNWLQNSMPSETGYMVFNLGNLPPQVVHKTKEDAEKEVERILSTLPHDKAQTVLVLKIEAAYTRNAATPSPVVLHKFEQVGVISTETVETLHKPYPQAESHATDAGVMLAGYGFHPLVETKKFDLLEESAQMLKELNDVVEKEKKLVEQFQKPKALHTTPAIPEGFIPWHGGECPVAGPALVDVIFDDGTRVNGCAGENLLWADIYPKVIIAYRPIRPESFKLEDGKWCITAQGERVHVVSHRNSIFGASAKDDGRLWYQNGDSLPVKYEENRILCLAADQGGAP